MQTRCLLASRSGSDCAESDSPSQNPWWLCPGTDARDENPINSAQTAHAPPLAPTPTMAKRESAADGSKSHPAAYGAPRHAAATIGGEPAVRPEAIHVNRNPSAWTIGRVCMGGLVFGATRRSRIPFFSTLSCFLANVCRGKLWSPARTGAMLSPGEHRLLLSLPMSALPLACASLGELMDKECRTTCRCVPPLAY